MRPSLTVLELHLQCRSGLTWLLAATTAAVGAALASGRLDAIPLLVSPPGAPYAVAFNIAVLSWSLLALAIVPVAGCALRDDQHRSMALLRTMIGRRQYVLGRALAAWLLTLALLLFGVAGYALAAAGGVSASALVVALFWIGLPNATLIAALIFASAALGRSLTIAWMGAFMPIAVVVLGLLGRHASGTAYHLTEPFALRVMITDIFALPSSALATAPLRMTEALLINRALWLAVAMALLALAVGLAYRRVAAWMMPALAAKDHARDARARLPERPLVLAQALRLSVFNLAFLARSLSVRVGLLVLVLVLVEGVGDLAPPFYLPNLPTQAELFAHLAGPYRWAAMGWAALVAVDLGQREHDQRIAALTRLLPVSPVVWLLAQVAALCALVLLLQAAATLTLLARSGAKPDAALILGALMSAVPIALAAAAALAIAVWTGTRQRAYLGVLLVAALGFALSGLAISPGIVQFARLPSLHLSDLLGLADVRLRWPAFAGYWLLVVAALLLAALSRRLRWAGRAAVLLAGLCLAAGLWLHAQTRPAAPLRGDAWQYAYERELRAYAKAPRPDLVKVELSAAFDPARRAVRLEGIQTYRQVSEHEVHVLAFSLPLDAETEIELLEAHRLIAAGTGYRVLALASPLAAGAELRLRYVSTLRAVALVANPRLSSQAQTILSPQFQPDLQYHPDREIANPNRRVELGLRNAASSSIASVAPAHRLFGTGNGSRIEFNAALRVPAGWSAVAPGQLRSVTPQPGGARRFAFASSDPIVPTFALAAQPWRKTSSSVGDIRLHLLYGANHDLNLPAIQASAGAALEHFQARFGRFPLSGLTIAEVPDGSIAPLSQSGLVLLPENAGYVQDLSMGGIYAQALQQMAVDPTVLVVAHEIAHQWWGLQLVPAEAPGGAWLAESVAHYLALALLDELKGRRRFRAALWQQQVEYFEGRKPGGDECALLACTHLAPHLAYAKGGLTLLALEDAVGRDRLQTVLAEHFREQRGIARPSDLLARFKHAFPKQRRLIEELFEQVTIHNVTIRAATPSADRQRLQLALALTAQTQGAGVTTGRRRLWLEWQDRNGDSIRRQVVALGVGVHALELPLPAGASRLVVDPDFLLLDPQRSDNAISW